MKEHFCPVEQSVITYQDECNWCGESEGSMNEIIEMARDSGMELYGLGKDRARFVHHLVAFAKLVAAKEREACAKVVDEVVPFGLELRLQKATIEDCAAAIRARGASMTQKALRMALEAL